MFIDSHAHLYWESFKIDLGTIIQRAAEAGVTHIINIGTDLQTSEQALNQAKNLTPSGINIYSTIGIHPHDAALFTENSGQKISNELEKLETLYLSNKQKIIAIGECGLDFFFENNPGFKEFDAPKKQVKELQLQLFTAQVNLSKQLGLPLIIHCRDGHSANPDSSAWQEVFKFLDPSLRGVFHCWSGSYEDAQKALKLGFFISFAGNITYKKSDNLRQIARLCPEDKLLIETDCPFLSPEGKRGLRNEPANVAEVARTIADAKGITALEIAKVSSKNTRKLFNI